MHSIDDADGTIAPAAPAFSKRFVSDNAADPEQYAVWIKRGERLGDIVAANMHFAHELRTVYLRELLSRTKGLLALGRTRQASG